MIELRERWSRIESIIINVFDEVQIQLEFKSEDSHDEREAFEEYFYSPKQSMYKLKGFSTQHNKTVTHSDENLPVDIQVNNNTWGDNEYGLEDGDAVRASLSNTIPTALI